MLRIKSKKITLFISIGLMTLIDIRSQSYIAFPTENARWYETFAFFGCGYPVCIEYYEFVVEGDTLMDQNSKLYSKIYEYGESNWEDNKYKAYFGALRNEGKNVLFMPWNSVEEKLLYNFELKVNDTTMFYLGDTAIVVSIDSVLVRDYYRKRYNIESIREIEDWYIYPYSIIEGIGSTNGLFAGPNVYTGFEDGWYELSCFWEDGGIVYNTDGAECHELNAIEDFTESLGLINVYPNPCNGNLFISKVTSNTLVEIFNSTGRKIIQRSIYKDADIDISSYQSGLYFIIITEHDKRHCHKIILMN